MNDFLQRLERDFCEQLAGIAPPAFPKSSDDDRARAREATPVPLWPTDQRGDL